MNGQGGDRSLRGPQSQAGRIAHLRLRSLRLTGPPVETAEDVVRWLGAVQSQDYGPAKWSIGQRTTGVGDADLDRAFDEGALLRTHVLRPTWHFVLPADIRWMLALTAPRVHALNAYMYRQLGLDGAARKRGSALLADALRGGNHLTRKDVDVLLRHAGMATDGFRLAYLLMHAELDGLICSGPRRGKQHTYALLDERTPDAAQPTLEEALATLTLRYFTSHGPATAKDFRSWSSLTAPDVKRGLEMVGSRLAHEVVDGVSYWFAPAAPPPQTPAPPPQTPAPRVHLLQGYDEYTVGYTESKYLLDISGAARAPTRRAVPIGVLILDSQVAGRWKRTVRDDGVVVEAALHTPFDDEQTRALHAAADRYGAFLGRPATVQTTAI